MNMKTAALQKALLRNNTRLALKNVVIMALLLSPSVTPVLSHGNKSHCGPKAMWAS